LITNSRYIGRKQCARLVDPISANVYKDIILFTEFHLQKGSLTEYNTHCI